MAGGTLFLAILAGSVMVWFRRMRAGANMDRNADSGGVQMVAFGPPQAGDEVAGEAMPRCRYLMPLLLLWSVCLYYLFWP